MRFFVELATFAGIGTGVILTVLEMPVPAAYFALAFWLGLWAYAHRHFKTMREAG